MIIRRFAGTVLLIVSIAALCVGCSPYRHTFTPDDPHWKDADDRHIEKPAMSDPSLAWQAVQRNTFEQIDQMTDLDRTLRHLGGNHEESWNINSFDEVPNSSWFTNRHHMNPLSRDEKMAGKYFNGGPDTSGVWTVSRPKVGGLTPGFWITDAKGDMYILKFDPPGNPEMSTAAAIITGRFFHAAGYNVPEETICYFQPEQLVIGEGVTYKDTDGNKVPFTQETLNSILKQVHVMPDGRVRCLASTLLPSVLGPFSFDGTRKDDPNDWCRHEHRRELRGLYVFCSFLNHWDIKDQNTMDIYANVGGRRFVQHFLLDFGTSMGSGGYKPADPRFGYTNTVDILYSMVSFMSLGLKVWPWEVPESIRYPSVGYFESKMFHPAAWKPGYPIPSFENMTHRDAYWAAKVLMSFDDEDIKALLDAGQLSNPRARDYLLATLKERQEKIGRHWFSFVNPLDYFESSPLSQGLEIRFQDLSVIHGFHTSSRSQFTVEYKGKTIVRNRQIAGNGFLISNDDIDNISDLYQRGNDPDNDLVEVVEVTITTSRDGGDYGPPVILWLFYHSDSRHLQLVGIEHRD